MTAVAAPASNLQDMIPRLHAFWSAQSCVIEQPYDLEAGARAWLI